MLLPPAWQFFSSLIDGCLKYKNKEKPKTDPRPGPRLNYDVKIGPKPKKSGPVGAGLKCRALAFPSVEITPNMRNSPNNTMILRRRRRKRAIIAACAYASVIMSSTILRNVWVRERSQDWWEHIVAGFTKEQWVRNFRMSNPTFDMLCQSLSTFLSYDDTTFRWAIPLQMRVGVALWWLATGAGYRTLAHLFGISSALVCLIVNDFCQAMRDELWREYIQLPQLEELQNVIRGFKTRWGFPQCAGAIDGSHIPVIAPSEDHTDYFNRKGWHSVILQAVVDHRFW